MKHHLVADAAAVTMFAGATVGAAASADGNNAPYEKSCVGIINSVQAADRGITPEESADLYFEGGVREYQEMQRNCEVFPG